MNRIQPRTREGVARPRQRGAALLTAMIIVALVTTMAGSMVLQQWRAVQVETAERARTQAAWILQGALDWSRLILREDAIAVDHLNEPWATPLAEARLSTFLAADRDNTDDAPEAFLSGRIDDAQSRFNLRNLVGEDNKPSKAAELALRNLCASANVSGEVASMLAKKMLASVVTPTDEAAANAAPLEPQTVDQLAWLGIDAASLNRLRPFITLLPDRTPVNLNTASREVLAAVIDKLDLASAERLVQIRTRSPFKSVGDAQNEVPNVMLDEKTVSIKSSYFEVTGQLRLGQRVLNERSLVHRSENKNVVTLRRQVLGTVI